MRAACPAYRPYRKAPLTRGWAFLYVQAGSDFIARLLSEENRLAMGAKLSWVEDVGRELNAIANATSSAAAPGSRFRASASAAAADGTGAPH
jgi:hypothetical protein